MSTYLTNTPDSTCACKDCQSMCQNRPCWPTPEEAEKIQAAGLGDRLMLEYYESDTDCKDEDDFTIYKRTELLVPALVGSEGQHAPWWPTGTCTFFQDGKCQLHEPGLKPSEGRKVDCKQPVGTGWQIHLAVIDTWDTDKGRAMVDEWRLNPHPNIKIFKES